MIKYKRFLILLSLLFVGGGDVKAVKADGMNAYQEKVNSRMAGTQVKVETAYKADSTDVTIFPEDQKDQTEEKKDAASSQKYSEGQQNVTAEISNAEGRAEAVRSAVASGAQSVKSMVSTTRS